MLTTDQKEKILRQAGMTVPDYPRLPAQARQPQLQQGAALQRNALQADAGTAADPVAQWATAIDTLFVQYSAERAARSLREAEQARQLDALRSSSTRPLQ